MEIGLPISELKEGGIYKCLLSGRSVYIITKEDTGVIHTKSYNEISGFFEFHPVYDYTLTKLNERNINP